MTKPDAVAVEAPHQPPPRAGRGGWAEDARQGGRYLAQAFRLMVGVPDYETYLLHMQARHADQEAMSYEAFFRERQEARYGSRIGRCC